MASSSDETPERSDDEKDECIWWDSSFGGRRMEIGKQLFCNRSLNMKKIVSVGFDMDYTLAQYKFETFESLAYEGTIKKLVDDLGYPQESEKERERTKYKQAQQAYHQKVERYACLYVLAKCPA